jgi:L,D-transpeptidase YcbB
VVATRIVILLIAVLSCAPAAAGDAPAEAVARHIQLALNLVGQDQEPRTMQLPPVATSSHDALAWFYAERDYAPVWHRGGRLQRLVSELEGLVQDGLDPDVYGIAELRRRALEQDRGVAEAACTDLLATNAYLTALQHLALGRLDPAEVEPVWRSGASESVDDQRLRVVMLAGRMLDDIGGAVDRVRPQDQRYLALRKAYAELELRAQSGDWPKVPGGPLLRAGMSDPRVSLLRSRLADHPSAWPPPVTGADVYDEGLVAAVTAFQRSHHLQADGVVGPETVAALNVPISARLEQVRINLERMRWLARAHEANYVLVDIAGATVSYVRDGEAIWSARTQFGRATRPTPRLRSEITHMTFHPTWTVPPTILRNDILPKIREDLQYLARQRIGVLDYAGNRLDPEGLDWDNPTGILLRQEAGPHNALGRVAIRFPNPFHVYLHDTPSQGQFAADRRALSSGCVRVERTMELVDLLIEDGTDGGAAQAAALLQRGRTANFHLARPVPILMAYWTADTDADGGILFRPDIYRLDGAISAAFAEQSARGTGFQCDRYLAVGP